MDPWGKTWIGYTVPWASFWEIIPPVRHYLCRIVYKDNLALMEYARVYSCPIGQGVYPLILYFRYRGWKSKNDLNVFVVILVVGCFHLRLVVVRWSLINASMYKVNWIKHVILRGFFFHRGFPNLRCGWSISQGWGSPDWPLTISSCVNNPSFDTLLISLCDCFQGEIEILLLLRLTSRTRYVPVASLRCSDHPTFWCDGFPEGSRPLLPLLFYVTTVQSPAAPLTSAFHRRRLGHYHIYKWYDRHSPFLFDSISRFPL